MNYPIAERKHPINGVPGRMLPVHAPQVTRAGRNLCHVSQKWVSLPRPIKGYGHNGTIQVNIRFDDNCRNGHQDFAVTAEVHTDESRRRRDIAVGGCMHEDITKIFPELEPLIKWHHVSTDGPMHYVAKTCYAAGDRDCWGKRKGEVKQTERRIKFGTSPITHAYRQSFLDWVEQCDVVTLRTVAVSGGSSSSGYKFSDHFTLKDDRSTYVANWSHCPFDNQQQAIEFIAAVNTGWEFVTVPTSWGEGKERELERARKAAIWPEATDEQLCLDREELTKLLEARLPALIADFRKDMDACGFLWEVQA